MRLISTSIFLLVMNSIFAQIVNIPDANFKNALLHTNCVDTDNNGFGEFDADINNNGEIEISEAISIKGLVLFNQSIDSLNGLEEFKNLEILLCNTNNIGVLDLTNLPKLSHLNCGGNEISALTVSNLTKLHTLKCFANKINSLDLSSSPLLTYLNCSDNQLEEINISNNPALEYFICSKNKISTIDVASCSQLNTFNCTDTKVAKIDLSKNHEITSLWLDNNSQLTNLNIANNNNTNISRMYAANNPMLDCIQVDDPNYNFPGCDDMSFSGWCKDTGTNYSADCNPSSNITLTEKDYSIFPNPVDQFLTIQSTQAISQITIYSSLGKLVAQSKNKQTISTSHLPRGLYFLDFVIGNSVYFQKIIKE